MSEDIVIKVKEEREGDALAGVAADAKKAEEALKSAAAAGAKPTAVAPSADQARAREEADKEKAKADVARLNKSAPAPPSAAVSPARLDALMKGQGYVKGQDGKWMKSTAGNDAVNAHFAAEDAHDAKGKHAQEAKDAKAAEAAREKEAEHQRAQKVSIEAVSHQALTERAGGNHDAAATLEKEAEIRKESLRIQMQLGTAETEATAIATAKFAAEEKIAAAKAAEAAEARAEALAQKEITKQKALQTAESKAALRSGLSGAANAVGGGLGGMGGMIGAAPAMLPIMAAMAVLGEAVGTAVSQASDRAKSRQEGFQAAGRLRTIQGKSGAIGEQEAGADASEQSRALEEARSKKGTFENVDPIADWGKGFLKFLGVKTELSGEKAERQNDLRIAQLEKSSPKASETALQKVKEGVGGMEIEQQEKILAGDLKGAKMLQYKIDKEKAYVAALRAVGGTGGAADTAEQKEYAMHAADLKIMKEKRDEALRFGSLVNARSGAGDVARAARLAKDYSASGGDFSKLAGHLEALHSTVKEQHQQVMRASGRKNY